MVDGSRRQRQVKDGVDGVAFFFSGGRKGMTGLDGLKMDDGLVMDQRNHLAQRHCWSGQSCQHGAVVEGRRFGVCRTHWHPSKKKSIADHHQASSKQQAARSSIQAARQLGLLARWAWLDCLGWGWLFLLTFDADDADEAWVALCQAEPVSLTLRSLVEVVVSVVGS